MSEFERPTPGTCRSEMVIATNLMEVGVDITGVELLILEDELRLAIRDPRVREAAALGWESDHFRKIFEERLLGGKTHAGPALTYTHVESAKTRLAKAADALRDAQGVHDPSLVTEYLAALAELLAYYVSFQRRSLMALLASLTPRPADCVIWTPRPLDTSPQVAPRGPNPAFPVISLRGGRSALGSAVLAA
ncbi:hypothetical protein ACH4JS_20460 [Streptomyces sp. NPDC017638]|uniref:hypothetical protein n=1 Tax=Streptomyces sp. NPDC017638 TaxID=3365004 RepID=UPI0037A63C74